MPELPDVEGFRRVLSQHAVGSRIERVEVLAAGVLRGVSVRSLRDALRGRRFGAPRRHGSCPRCGTTLSRGRTGGRGTVWCPTCQPTP